MSAIARISEANIPETPFRQETSNSETHPENLPSKLEFLQSQFSNLSKENKRLKENVDDLTNKSVTKRSQLEAQNRALEEFKGHLGEKS